MPTETTEWERHISLSVTIPDKDEECNARVSPLFHDRDSEDHVSSRRQIFLPAPFGGDGDKQEVGSILLIIDFSLRTEIDSA